MSKPLLELIALGMALGSRSFRKRIGPEHIRDDELRLLFLSLQRGEKAMLRVWFKRLGVDCDTHGNVYEAMAARLEEDAEHERTLECLQEMLAEATERREQREREERDGKTRGAANRQRSAASAPRAGVERASQATAETATAAAEQDRGRV